MTWTEYLNRVLDLYMYPPIEREVTKRRASRSRKSPTTEEIQDSKHIPGENQWMLLLTTDDLSLKDFAQADNPIIENPDLEISSEDDQLWETVICPRLRQRLLHSLCLSAFRDDNRFSRFCLQKRFSSIFNTDAEVEEDLNQDFKIDISSV